MVAHIFNPRIWEAGVSSRPARSTEQVPQGYLEKYMFRFLYLASKSKGRGEAKIGSYFKNRNSFTASSFVKSTNVFRSSKS